MLPRRIETERLRLRLPRVDDATIAYETWCSDPEVARYLTWSPHPSVEHTRAFLGRCVELWNEGRGHLPWIVERRRDARIVGMLGITLESHPRIQGDFEPHRSTMGYAFGRAFWGQGFATEASRAAIAATFSVPSIRRVWSVCDVENVASARVLEKAGMSFEGILRRYVLHPSRSDQPRDVRCYAIVR